MFDYARQARLYVAPPQLNPKSADFARRAAPLVEEILDRTGGRAFVLFTSYARMREVHGLLRERLAFPVKVQGDLPRSALLDWFRSTKHAVLFATGTFWEGIDVVGDALSCVVIDRLPFPSPSEPLVAARIAALEARGKSGFEHYMIPSAIVRLKQGFGRLIRSTSDRGLVAILDGRATSMRYGATIVAALPPATRITDLSALDGLFRVAPRLDDRPRPLPLKSPCVGTHYLVELKSSAGEQAFGRPRSPSAVRSKHARRRRLFRAVHPAGLDDIRATGVYRLATGNVGKYFYPGFEQAKKMAARWSRIDRQAYTVTPGLFERDTLPEPIEIATEGPAYHVPGAVFPHGAVTIY